MKPNFGCLKTGRKKAQYPAIETLLMEKWSVHQLKRKRRWVIKQDNDPKHRSKSTKENMLSVVAQGTDLNVIQMQHYDWFWPDNPILLLNSNSFVERNGPKFPKCSAGLICNYMRHLVQVIADKIESNSYYIQGFIYFFHLDMWMFTYVIKVRTHFMTIIFRNAGRSKRIYILFLATVLYPHTWNPEIVNFHDMTASFCFLVFFSLLTADTFKEYYSVLWV